MSFDYYVFSKLDIFGEIILSVYTHGIRFAQGSKHSNSRTSLKKAQYGKYP